jgi:hypothetical protein
MRFRRIVDDDQQFSLRIELLHPVQLLFGYPNVPLSIDIEPCCVLELARFFPRTADCE